VVAGMEKPVESASALDPPAGKVELRMLGTMAVVRDGSVIALPSSRKLRGLLAYLSVASQPVTRTRLCELLWDVPNDPRGELRWCLSKLRRILDDPGGRRVEAHGDSVRLDLSDCLVDVAEVAGAARDGIEKLDRDRLHALSRMFRGEFLDGLEIDRSPHFNAWLTAERRRYRGQHVAIVEHLVRKTEGEDVFGHLEKWLQLAPFDRRVHETLLNALARAGRIQEGEKHLAATARLFESEGLDAAPIAETWRRARVPASSAPASSAHPVSVVDPAPRPDANAPVTSRRASIAIMPFASRGGLRVGYADGLVHDVITRLAKLRSIFVIAQGTVFALHERSVDAAAAGRTLNVDYIVSGWVQTDGPNVTVAVELAETRSARILWAEVFTRKLDDAFIVLDEIGNRVVASVASEVETAERNRAILKAPSSLDAWEAFHRGLWHMYRFEKSDNDRAQQFFEMAVRLDPTFARAYAGLSFTHWQSAFQGWAPREREIDRAFDFAGQSMMADDRDPSAHWAMGRALWLRGRQDQSIAELETAVDLSPNFALGYYSLAFVHAQAGDAQAAIGSADHSRHLSPYDPMLFAMLACRAMSLVRLGNFAEAAEWGRKAAARPNAHPHIIGLAAFSLALAGRLDEAQNYVAILRRQVPSYGLEDFLKAFRFEPSGAALFRDGARLLGLA
jgi:DNA-binding SARP family transcriptional activator/TolB-like protein